MEKMMVTKTENKDTAGADQIKEALFDNRIVIISNSIDSKVASATIANLLALDYQDNSSPITIYQNSPGGEVTSGFAIYDTIRFLKSPVYIVNTGLCASIATIINISVPKENRFSMPNCKFLIHQPLISGQVQGVASDLEITAKDIVKTRAKINTLLAQACGQDIKKVEQDTTRDYWMTAAEALDYGLIGKIIDKMSDIK